MTKSGISRNLLFLTKTLSTFFIVSVLIYLNFVDLNENSKNRIYLNLLKNISDKCHDSRLSFKDYELKRLDTLKVNHPELYRKHESSRIALVKTLNTYGALITRSSKGSDENNNNLSNIILLMTNDSLRNDIKANINHLTSVLEKPREAIYDDIEEDNINTALDLFNTYPRTEKVELITAIDTNVLRRKCDSLLSQSIRKHLVNKDTLLNTSSSSRTVTYNSNRYRPEDDEVDNGSGGVEALRSAVKGKKVLKNEKQLLFYKEQTFNGLCIYNNQVIISITDSEHYGDINNAFDRNGGQGDDGGMSYAIAIPAKTVTTTFPSTLILAGFPSDVINELYDKNLQVDLRNQYGNAKLSMIDDITIDIYKKNNAPISILGFDLSRKWFPIALFIVITIVLFILFLTIQKSKSSLLINKDIGDDDVLSLLVNNKAIRFFLWVLASPIILFLVINSSPIHYDKIMYCGLFLCCILSVILGVLSYIKSLKL